MLVAFVVVFVADSAEHHASSGIVFAFVFSGSVAAAQVWVCSSVLPRFCAVPNIGYYSNGSSSVGAAGSGCVGSSTGVRTNCGLCSIFSNPGQHRNKSLEHDYNSPSRGYSSVNDTSGLPINATTSRSRNTCPHLCRAQHTRSSCQG